MPLDKWVAETARKVQEGTATRPKSVQDPEKTYAGRVLTEQNYQPTTPALQPEEELAKQTNYEKLAPWENWVAERLPGFTQSSVGKALTWFGDTWAGKMLGYLDVAAEGMERASGFVAQAIHASGDDETNRAFWQDELAAAWYAGGLTADMTNLPDLVRNEDGGYKMVIPSDLPGIRGLVEARKKIADGTPLEQVREEYYNNQGALSLRAQMQDLAFHIVADPLNYIMPVLKPVEKIKAAGIALRTYRASDDWIDMTKGAIKAGTTKLDELTVDLAKAEELGDAVKIEDLTKQIAFMEAEVLAATEGVARVKPLKTMNLRERSIYKLTGGDMLAPGAGKVDFLGRSIGVWNPFGLTPAARAHEYVNVLSNGVGNYILSRMDDPERIAAEILDAYNGAMGNQLNHFFMTPEGAAVQSSIGAINKEAQELFGAWKLLADERAEVGTFAKALGSDVDEVVRLMKESPPTLAKRLMDKGLDVDAKHLDALYKKIDDVPFSPMEWKYKLSSKIQDIAAEQAVLRFGVKARGFLEKASFALKSAETLAFLRLNPGYVMRNFWNNEFTMIARGLGGNFSGQDVEKFIKEVLQFEPVRFGQAYTMVGEGALQDLAARGATVGTSKIEDALRGDPNFLDNISRGIKDVNLGKLDMGELAQKVERYASQRAYLKGYNQGWRRYYWKPDVGYDTIGRYDNALKADLDTFNGKISRTIDNALRGAWHEQDIDDVTRVNMNNIVENVLEEANKRAGFDIEDILEPEFVEQIRTGLREAAEGGTIDDFMNGVRNNLEDHLDTLNLGAKDHYRARTVELIKAEGAQGYASIIGDTMDEFWGAHDVYAEHMKLINSLDINDPQLAAHFWNKLEKRNARYWNRQFDRLDEAIKGMKEGAEEAGLKVNPEIYDRFDDWKKLTKDFYKERKKLHDMYYGRKNRGKKPKIEYEVMNKRLDTSYEKLIGDEHKYLRAIDTYVSEHLPILENGVPVRELHLAWRDAVAKLRREDKIATLEFRRASEGMTRRQKDIAWKQQWAAKQELWQEIRTAERIGFRASEGDPDAIETLLVGARQRRAAYDQALSLHNKYVSGQALTPEEDAFLKTWISDNIGIDTSQDLQKAILEKRIKDIQEQGFKPVTAAEEAIEDAAPSPFTPDAEELPKVDFLEEQLEAAKKDATLAELNNDAPKIKETQHRVEVLEGMIEEAKKLPEPEAPKGLSPEEAAQNADIARVQEQVAARKKQHFQEMMEDAANRVEQGVGEGEDVLIRPDYEDSPHAQSIERSKLSAEDPEGIYQTQGRGQPLREDQEFVSTRDASTYPDWYKEAQKQGVKKDTMINQLRKMAETGEIADTKSAEVLVSLVMGDPYYADDIMDLLDTPAGWNTVNDALMNPAGVMEHPAFRHMSQEDINLFIDWYFTYDIEKALGDELAGISDDLLKAQTQVFDEYTDILTRQEKADLGTKLSDFKAAEHGGDIPLSVTEDQYWLNKGQLSLDYIEDAAKTQAAKPPLKWRNMPAELQGRLEKYLEHVKTQMSDARYASTRFAEFRRDSALLNYNRRMNYNTYLGMLAPYEFWFTQSLGKWALHSIDRPAMLTSYLKIKEFMNTAGGPNANLPSRMKGQIRVKLPFVEQMAPWLGEQFIDPMRMALPFDTFFNFPEQYIQESRGIDGATKRLIQQEMENGNIPEDIGLEAMETMSGEVWDNARVTVEGDREGKDAWDFMSLMISPHAPLTWAYEAASGSPEDIQPFTPLTRFSKAFSSLMGMEDFPLFPHNMEAKLRTSLGLPPFDKWEDYRSERMLSNMVALNEITLEEAEYAMSHHDGPAWEEAVRKSGIEYGLKGTIGFFGLPAQAFPEGERQMRSLADDYNKAYELQDEGALDALTVFWKNNPEWGTRLALWKSPEEKMHRFMVDQVYSAYYELPQLNRREARDQLGANFEQLFLNKETQSHESIDVETLNLWSRLLKGEVGMLNGEARPLELAPPDVAWRAESYYRTRDAYFPNSWDLQEKYYNEIPPGSPKKDFLASNPRLSQYWNWRSANFPNWFTLQEGYYALPKAQRKAYLNQNPELKAFWDQRRSLYPDYKKMGEAYRSIEGIGEREAFLQGEGAELKKFWDWKHDYFHRNPEVVPYLSEDYEFNYSNEKEEFAAQQAQPDINWNEWEQTLTPQLSRLAIDYMNGDDLPSWVLENLEEIAANRGMTFDELMNELGTSYSNR